MPPSLPSTSRSGDQAPASPDAARENTALPPAPDLLGTILDNVDAHIFLKAEDGRFLYAGPKTQELYGLASEQILGHTDEELLPPETAAKLREFDVEVMRTGKPATREERIPDPSGQERWFLSRKMPVKLGDGSLCLIGLSTDITERKKLDKELQRSEAALLSILRNLPYPTMVTTLPPQEHVTFVNSRFAEIFGYTGAEFDSLHTWSKLAHPDEKYRQEVADWWNTALEGVLQKEGVVEARELQVTAKDGRKHDVIASATIAGERLVLTLRDITKHKEEEEKLRISEERHRFLADSARDTVWTMEPDGRISYVSPSVEIVRGFTPDEAMAQTLEQIHPPESLAVSSKWWEQMHVDMAAGRKPQSFRGELAYYRKDGSVFWAEVMAYPLLHPDGSLAQVIGVTRDIAERKEAELLLKRSETKFRRIFETASDGLIILNSENCFIEANPAALEMFGCADLQTFLACKPADFSPPKQPVGRPSDDLAREHIRAALSGQAVRFEWVHRRMDDRREFPCDISLSPIELEGKPAILAKAQDLTERKRAEEALQQSEELFRIAFDESPLGACLVGLDGRILKTNPQMAKIFGYSRRELEGMTVNDLAVPEDTSVSGAQMSHAIQDHVENVRFEKRYIHRDGHLVHGEVSTSLVRDAAGEPRFFVSQVQDISPRKLAEQALVKAEAQYRMRTETINDLIWTFDPEAKKFIYVSPTCERIFGFTADELLERPVTETLLPDPIQVARLEEMIRSGIGDFLSGKIGEGDFTSVELEHTRKDGSSIFAELSYRFLRNSDTGRIEVLGSTRDVTQRRETEQKLRQRERELEQAKDYYRLLLENSTDVVVQGNNEGVITWITPSVTGLVGWLPDEMVGHDFAEFVHPDDLDALRPFQQNLLRGIGGQVVLRIRRRGAGIIGRRRSSVRFSMSRERSPAGWPDGATSMRRCSPARRWRTREPA